MKTELETLSKDVYRIKKLSQRVSVATTIEAWESIKSPSITNLYYKIYAYNGKLLTISRAKTIISIYKRIKNLEDKKYVLESIENIVDHFKRFPVNYFLNHKKYKLLNSFLISEKRNQKIDQIIKNPD